MFLQPVAEGGIHAALPTLAGRFEGIENVVVEPDGSRFLLSCSWRSAARGLFDRFLCFFAIAYLFGKASYSAEAAVMWSYPELQQTLSGGIVLGGLTKPITDARVDLNGGGEIGHGQAEAHGNGGF